MTEMATLPEVVHQGNKDKFRQHVSNKMAALVLGFIQVNIKISHQVGFLAPEAPQGLLLIREVGQHGQWKVCSNDWGPVCASDDITAYHVWSMEARQLKASSRRPVLLDQAHASLCSADAGRPGFQTENYVA